MISVILDDLGTCPLWGNNGHVEKILKLNPKVDANNIKLDDELIVPLEYLSRPDLVLFQQKHYISPKSSKNNICTNLKKAAKKERKRQNQLAVERRKTDNFNKNKKKLADEKKIARKKEALKEEALRMEKLKKEFPYPLLGMNEEFTFVDYSELKIKEEGLSLKSIKVVSTAELKKKKIIEFVVTFSEPVKIIGSPILKVQAKGNLGFAYYKKRVSKESLSFYQAYDYELKKVSKFRVYFPREEKRFRVYGNKNVHFKSKETYYEINSEFFDKESPRISKIEFLSEENFATNDEISILAHLNEPVMMKGKPSLKLVFTSGIKTAKFYKFSNNYKTMVFLYKVKKEDYSPLGIEVSGRLLKDGVQIRDRIGNTFENEFQNVFVRNSKIIKKLPRVTSVILPKKKRFKLGEDISIKLKFSDYIKVKGNPRIKLRVGSENKFANFLNSTDGIVEFKYTVRNNDFDENGIVIFPRIDYSLGKILDRNNELSISKFVVDEQSDIIIDSGRIYVERVISPSKRSYKVGERVDIGIKFNEIVKTDEDVFLNVLIGEKIIKIPLRKGNGTNRLIFSYFVESDSHKKKFEVLSPLIGKKNSLKSLSGNIANVNFNAVGINSIDFDTVSPTIVNIESPQNETLVYEDTLSILVYFSEKVVVNGQPRIRLDLQSGTVFANYKEGSGSDVLRFDYIIRETDQEPKGVSLVSPVDFLNGNIFDKVGNKLNRSFKEVPSSKLIVSGQLKYGLVQDSKGRKQNVASHKEDGVELTYAAALNFGHVKLEAVDKLDGSAARLSSSLAVGGYFSATLLWNPIWSTGFELGFREIQFEEATNIKLLKTSNTYFKIASINSYSFRESFRLNLDLVAEQLPFIHAKSTKTLVIDPITLLQARLGFSWDFYRYSSLNFGVGARVDFMAGKTTDNFELESGSGLKYFGYAEKTFNSRKLRFEGYLRKIEQNSTIFEQSIREIGIDVSYLFL